jgi:beta-galactosidase
MKSEELYRGNTRKLFQGKALVVVRSARTAGALTLSATAQGLKGDAIKLASRR